MAALQFGVTLQAAGSPKDFHQLVRRADDLGYDVLAAPDHLGFLGPFSSLASAAVLTERLRLRTYVLNASFWNAALLSREVATVDLLSGGRVELGVGAGHMRSEYDDAGLPWRPLKERIQVLADLVLDVRRRLGDEEHTPRAVQRPVPVMIGAMSKDGLALAAEHADIVGFAGLRQIEGEPPGNFTLASGAETAERVEHVRRVAGGRSYRSDILLQAVLLGA
ncbi:MAG: LLM class flavin-dependent oxidoreductase, partial [Actinomycetota bacterium]|nr:LLM class flavin-dependent oxidoreductase [Actinomycetota bacterium]